MKKKDLFRYADEYLVPSYKRNEIIIVKGKGSLLWDIDGKRYIDFFPGWGVDILGHCPSAVMNAVRYQAARLVHVPNNFYHIPQIRLAKAIGDLFGFPVKSFFCNSGAEAVEGAYKLMRLWGNLNNKTAIVAFHYSFHGRTLAALSLTGQARHQKPFEPLIKDIHFAYLNDFESVLSIFEHHKVAGVIVEPIQGEGGVNVCDEGFLRSVADLCRQKGALLALDEVQTGFGRTGKWFAFQHYGIEPDIVALAKGMGGGMPIGAVVAKKEIADLFTPGMHGSTYGGGPVVSKAALAVINEIKRKGLAKRAEEISGYIFDFLAKAAKEYPEHIKEVRGKGLMIGVELFHEGARVVDIALRKGLIINCTQGNVLRLLPALNIPKTVLKEGLGILKEVFDEAFHLSI